MTMDACHKTGLPEPTLEEVAGSMQVTFLKDNLYHDYLERIELNVWQIEAFGYVKANGSIRNSVYQQINNIGKMTNTEDHQLVVGKKSLKHKKAFSKPT